MVSGVVIFLRYYGDQYNRPQSFCASIGNPGHNTEASIPGDFYFLVKKYLIDKDAVDSIYSFKIPSDVAFTKRIVK